MSLLQAKEAERKAIIEGIERNGGAASERIIQKVLEKRHAQVKFVFSLAKFDLNLLVELVS